MTDISAYGSLVNIVASNTFPAGFGVTQFADDTDPFDFPEMQIADGKSGVNGDLVTWTVASPIEFALAVVPGSDDDKNLSILFEANRAGKGKASAKDIITLTGINADGEQVTLTNGKITNGMPGTGISSAGRKKTKTYKFKFENKSGSN